MSSDQPEGVEPQRGSSGRSPRVGDSRSPVGSTLSIVLALIAVVAGFLILREVLDDDDPSTSEVGSGADTPSASTLAGGVTLPSVEEGDDTNAVGGDNTTTTLPTLTRTGATIAVANASGQGGSAASMSSALTTAGYEGVGEAGNSTGEQLSQSVVYFVTTNPAAQEVAESSATELGGVPAAAMPDPRPARDGDTATADVLVMLGTDAANKPLSELAAAATSTTAG